MTLTVFYSKYLIYVINKLFDDFDKLKVEIKIDLYLIIFNDNILK